MPKPVCVGCQCFYRPKRNGYAFIEGKPDGPAVRFSTADSRRGTKLPEAWTPYKLWNGDLWQCPECAHEIIVGVIGPPLSEHYLPDFDYRVKQFRATLQVNDC